MPLLVKGRGQVGTLGGSVSLWVKGRGQVAAGAGGRVTGRGQMGAVGDSVCLWVKGRGPMGVVKGAVALAVKGRGQMGSAGGVLFPFLSKAEAQWVQWRVLSPYQSTRGLRGLHDSCDQGSPA